MATKTEKQQPFHFAVLMKDIESENGTITDYAGTIYDVAHMGHQIVTLQSKEGEQIDVGLDDDGFVIVFNCPSVSKREQIVMAINGR